MVEVGPPLKPSVLTLTGEEIDDLDGLIAQGILPPDWIDRCDKARTANVFGHDHKTDRHGAPIEQGIGSTSQMTMNSIEAYKKWCKDEPDYERNLARMLKLFDEQQPRREAARLAEREAARKDRQKIRARAQ